MRSIRNILIVRLSALGDVAILQPVLLSRAQANPDCHFYLAAPPLLAPLFDGIDNVTFLPTKKQSSRSLYRVLKQYHPDLVLDLHHVNRTIGMSWLFRLHAVPVRSIRKRNHPGRPSWQRYDEVFDRGGLASDKTLQQSATKYWTVKPSSDGVRTIGIAPFAQHRGKIWTEANLLQLLSMLDKSSNIRVLLFGSKAEAPQLESWASQYDNVESVAGRFSFADELEQISQLDVMVSMDSANMHFASCLGVPVVSVWGATHPKRGFYGWRQHPGWTMQADMRCRPCSKYGKNPCKYGDYPCMQAVEAERVLAAIKGIVAIGNCH